MALRSTVVNLGSNKPLLEKSKSSPAAGCGGFEDPMVTPWACQGVKPVINMQKNMQIKFLIELVYRKVFIDKCE